MRDGGSIILNASASHLKGYPGISIYAASKAAVRSFARSWASDLKDRKIRVNSLSPGVIDTGASAAIPKEARDFFLSQVPLARLGLAKDIAAAVLYLASDDSSYVTAIDPRRRRRPSSHLIQTGLRPPPETFQTVPNQSSTRSNSSRRNSSEMPSSSPQPAVS